MEQNNRKGNRKHSSYKRIGKIAAVCMAALLIRPETIFADEPGTVLEEGAKAASDQDQLNAEVILNEGWQFQNEHWYYINQDGSPATGWKDIDGLYYYFHNDAAMAGGSLKDGETLYTFAPEKGNVLYAKKEKNLGGGSFPIGFYDSDRQVLADALNELKEDDFDGDEDDDYYEDEKKNYDKDASFIISGRLTEIAEHRLNMARTKGYGNGEIPGEGNLDSYIKSIRYNSGRRFMEVYLKNCEDVDDAEQKLLRSHGSDEKKRKDRAVYYSEMGIAHTVVDGKQYYMVIFMK